MQRNHRSPLFIGVALAACLCGGAGAQTAAPPLGTTPVDREVKVAEQAFTRDPQTPAWVTLVALPEVEPKGPVTVALSDAQIHVGDPVVTFVHRSHRASTTRAR